MYILHRSSKFYLASYSASDLLVRTVKFSPLASGPLMCLKSVASSFWFHNYCSTKEGMFFVLCWGCLGASVRRALALLVGMTRLSAPLVLETSLVWDVNKKQNISKGFGRKHSKLCLWLTNSLLLLLYGRVLVVAPVFQKLFRTWEVSCTGTVLTVF